MGTRKYLIRPRGAAGVNWVYQATCVAPGTKVCRVRVFPVLVIPRTGRTRLQKREKTCNARAFVTASQEEQKPCEDSMEHVLDYASTSELRQGDDGGDDGEEDDDDDIETANLPHPTKRHQEPSKTGKMPVVTTRSPLRRPRARPNSTLRR